MRDPLEAARKRSTKAYVGAPCTHCPFRKDVPIYLRPERRAEIAQSLLDDCSFPCHEHVEWSEDDDGEEYVAHSGPGCAGAMKALMLIGGSTNLLRVSERLDLVDTRIMEQRGADVWDLDTWQRVPEGKTGDTWDANDDDDFETCNTVNAGCLAPAGYMGAGGGIIHGAVPADLECPSCGESVCSNCVDDEGLCGNCSEDGYE